MRLMTSPLTMTRVRATTPTKPRVRRAWKLCGANRRRPRPMRSRTDERRTPRSAFGEGVTDTPDREDERGDRRIVLDLVAQVADVDVDRLLVLVEGLVIAQQLKELGAREDPARAGG